MYRSRRRVRVVSCAVLPHRSCRSTPEARWIPCRASPEPIHRVNRRLRRAPASARPIHRLGTPIGIGRCHRGYPGGNSSHEPAARCGSVTLVAGPAHEQRADASLVQRRDHRGASNRTPTPPRGPLDRHGGQPARCRVECPPSVPGGPRCRRRPSRRRGGSRLGGVRAGRRAAGVARGSVAASPRPHRPLRSVADAGAHRRTRTGPWSPRSGRRWRGSPSRSRR
jgi:hypothetical protein